MTPTLSLADRIAAVSPSALLPTRLANIDNTSSDSPFLVAAHRLGVGLWLTLVEAGGAHYAAPIVDEGLSLRRAIAGDGAAEAITRLMSSDPGQSPFTWNVLHTGQTVAGERAIQVDQTHESLVIGESAVVKWMVRAEATPAVSLVAHLSRSGFTQMPRPWGFVTWAGPTGDISVASVADFLPGATDGWEWCVDDATGFSRGNVTLEAARRPVAKLAELVAQLHVALARPSEVFPEPVRTVDSEQLGHWLVNAQAILGKCLAGVSGAEGERLRERRARIDSTLAELERIPTTATMPVHGDLHVGQILRWDEGYAINDFDGNPVLPPGQRGTRQPAARDVAGMLQALDHVGRIVNRRVEDSNEVRTRQWIAMAQGTFQDVYLSQLHEAGMTQLMDERLLMPFRVEQELREYLYAETHLPRWRYVPDAAMGALVPKE